MVAVIGAFQSAAARSAEPSADNARRVRPEQNAAAITVTVVTVTIGAAARSNLFTPYDASGRLGGEWVDPLMAGLTEEQRKEKEEGEALVRQLDAMRDSQKSDRREALMQKIERIKKQLEMLRALAAINPQAAARQ